jgi:hypothetical protein
MFGLLPLEVRVFVTQKPPLTSQICSFPHPPRMRRSHNTLVRHSSSPNEVQLEVEVEVLLFLGLTKTF